MLRLSGTDQRVAAILHDVVEDTSVTLANLGEAGFSAAVVNAVDALTKRHGETRLAAAARAKADPIALSVKLADNAENMDMSRITRPTANDHARMKEYEQVRALLLG